ncbi:Complement C1q tumor necrosis factor-related protein 3 [Oryzias melastigma]|uniref:Complement C1q tumor necrosis factor-related protein 3 n=1 Tax=Oryzias melastigma TaxID=30732 RepID=A0A834FLA7_ORYME|nr:Complement C1q tumor necrosis factor-related protein 3 [Oryzias melastigma]
MSNPFEDFTVIHNNEGIFTATVSGVYFFRFSMFNNLNPTPNSVVSLKKNGELLTSVWDTSGTDSHDMGSNAAVIPLKVGDNVYVELQENKLVYDSIFTATVSGVYFFRFSMFNNLSPTPNSVVCLKKNNERLTSVWDVNGSDSNDMGSNAAVISLKVGDNVYVELQANRLVFDDAGNYNTFSIFTATVSGVYFFRFSMFNNLSPTPNSVVVLKKNDESLTSVWDTNGTDSNDMGSNAAVIPLKVGDNVYVELQANRLVYDDGMNYNTFSGFLLFTM